MLQQLRLADEERVESKASISDGISLGISSTKIQDTLQFETSWLLPRKPSSVQQVFLIVGRSS